MYLIDDLMKKLDYPVFKRKQLDIIEEIQKKEAKVIKFYFYTIIFQMLIDNEIIAITMVLEVISLIFFLTFKKRYLLVKLRESINS